MARRSAATILGLCLMLAAPLAPRAQVVVVPAFPVGAPTFASHLQDVDVAAVPDGSFAVVWGDYQLNNLSGSGDHATLRRFSAMGEPLGAAVRIDTSAHVFDPRLALDGQGGFAASWLWIGGGEYRFFGQTLDAQGLPRGGDFEITIDVAGHPASEGPVVGTPDGPIFFWDEHGMWARRLDAERHRRGGDIRVSENMYKTDADVFPDGGFVVTWKEFFAVAPSLGRIFGPTGQPRGPVFVVSTSLEIPRVATSPRGGFAVAGIGWDAAAQAAQVVLRRFADDGTPLGPEIVVEQAPSGTSVDPDLAYDDRGNLLVAWAQYRQATALPPRARAYDTAGVALGPAVDIGPEGSAEIRVARLADGRLVNVWYWNARATGSIVAICTPGMATCGDGVRVAACEECDDGAANGSAPDACRSDCRSARCGDGVTDAGEACDDGNATPCDGCSPTCAVESGVACGDGVVNQACGEECDQGPANGNTPDGCRVDCRLARCGDGVVDTGEECDDGNDVACDGCGVDCVVEATSPSLCAPQTFARVSAGDLARFEHGRQEFLETENVATGLGPVFNGRRCAECHSTPTIGGSSARNVTRIGAGSGLGFDPLTGVGGPLLQANGISTATCTVAGEVVPPEAVVVAERNTPALFGLGLVEAIPEASIRRMRDHQRAPLSGRLNINRATGLVGRFGWKAQFPTLHDFAAEAYRDEIGITSPFAPDEVAPQGMPTACDGAPEVEDNGDDVAAFVDFMTLLAPVEQPPPSLEARRGRRYFRRCKCRDCHTDKYKTGITHPVPALRRVKVPLFSDLLVHDMGSGLADGITQEFAEGSEFRTAPLWGVRFSAPYLHDGRAATLEEAILAHGGEAQESRNRFLLLDATQRAMLVAYLNSL
jgi:cysteine-rich repeat protein